MYNYSIDIDGRSFKSNNLKTDLYYQEVGGMRLTKHIC